VWGMGWSRGEGIGGRGGVWGGEGWGSVLGEAGGRGADSWS